MTHELIPYSLIAKFLSGQCTASEELELVCWREASDDNEAQFQEMRNEWKALNHEPSAFVFPDKEETWKDIWSKTVLAQSKSINYTRATLIKWVGAAACIALLLGFSLPFLMKEPLQTIFASKSETTTIVPMGQKSQLILADGTNVWLNSGSKLTYYGNGYNNRSRTVELEGEAFFEVVHEAKREFVVKAGGVDVTVLGTSFNVSCYPTESMLSVSLMKGRVRLSSSKDDALLAILDPNQAAKINKADLSCKVITCDANAESIWRQNIMRIEGATAEEVFKKMERWYGVQITCVSRTPSTHYWFTIKTESLMDILNSIDKLTPIEYHIDGEEVTVRYK